MVETHALPGTTKNPCLHAFASDSLARFRGVDVSHNGHGLMLPHQSPLAVPARPSYRQRQPRRYLHGVSNSLRQQKCSLKTPRPELGLNSRRRSGRCTPRPGLACSHLPRPGTRVPASGDGDRGPCGNLRRKGKGGTAFWLPSWQGRRDSWGQVPPPTRSFCHQVSPSSRFSIAIWTLPEPSLPPLPPSSGLGRPWGSPAAATR